MKKRLAVVLAGCALFTAGCEWTQYDDAGAECRVSDGRYEIRVDIYSDSDQPKESPLPDLARRLCAEIARG